MKRSFGLAWVASAWLCAAGAARADDMHLIEAQAREGLEARSVDEIRIAIETLGLSPTPSAAAALVARARRGLTPELLEVTVATLGAMQQPAAVPLLVELARHRRPAVRVQALEALGAIGGADAIRALRLGVDDGDPAVRIAAVRALGATQDRASVPLLLRAFDRGLLEASETIGKLGSPDEVRTLLGHLGHVPLETVLGGLREALSRADLPQRLRLDLVARLTELATVNVRVFFEDVLPALPGGVNDPVRRAVNDAIVRISG